MTSGLNLNRFASYSPRSDRFMQIAAVFFNAKFCLGVVVGVNRSGLSFPVLGI